MLSFLPKINSTRRQCRDCLLLTVNLNTACFRHAPVCGLLRRSDQCVLTKARKYKSTKSKWYNSGQTRVHWTSRLNSISESYRESPVQFSVCRPTVATEAFRGLTKFLQINVKLLDLHQSGHDRFLTHPKDSSSASFAMAAVEKVLFNQDICIHTNTV